VIVLDTGALIALERDDRGMWAELARATAARQRVVVPAGALSQAWRGGGRQVSLTRALAGTSPASFDDQAMRAGELCGKTATSDVIDASVALVAATAGTLALYTSDKPDLDRLLAANAGHLPTVVAV